MKGNALIRASAFGEICVAIVALWSDNYDVAQTSLLLAIAMMMFDRPKGGRQAYLD